MAGKGEFRQFHIKFWLAPSVEEMDPIEKLLYIYLITSPRSNMEGVYKSTIKRIAFETGIDRDMIPKISARFEQAGIGGIRADNSGDVWVVCSHAPDFLSSSASIKQYFAENLRKVPQDIRQFMSDVGYKWPAWVEELDIGRGVPTVPPPSPQGGTTIPPGWGEYVSDTDTDTDTETNTSTAAPSSGGGMSPMQDPVADIWQNALTSISPVSTWSNVGKERQSLTRLGRKTAALMADTGTEDARDLIQRILTEYQRARETAKTDYWRHAPFTPSAVETRWSDVITRVAEAHASRNVEVAF